MKHHFSVSVCKNINKNTFMDFNVMDIEALIVIDPWVKQTQHISVFGMFLKLWFVIYNCFEMC